jgi:hypothetical protein
MKHELTAINLIIKPSANYFSFISIKKFFYMQPLLYFALPGLRHVNLLRAACFWVRSGHETTLPYSQYPSISGSEKFSILGSSQASHVWDRYSSYWGFPFCRTLLLTEYLGPVVVRPTAFELGETQPLSFTVFRL